MLSIHSANRVINFFCIKVCWSAVPSETILRPRFRTHQLNRCSPSKFSTSWHLSLQIAIKISQKDIELWDRKNEFLISLTKLQVVPLSQNGVQTFLPGELFFALISVTIVNLLVTPLTIFLNVLVILAVKAKPQLRNKYNVLLACLAGTDVMTGALGQPFFIAELIYRL